MGWYIIYYIHDRHNMYWFHNEEMYVSETLYIIF